MRVNLHAQKNTGDKYTAEFLRLGITAVSRDRTLCWEQQQQCIVGV